MGTSFPYYRHCFDNADSHADWRERLGYFFSRPSYLVEGYCKVTLGPPAKCKEIAKKTSSIVLRVFLCLLNCLGAAKIGKACLSSSKSHQKCCQLFSNQVAPPPKLKELESTTAQGFDETADRLSFLDGVLGIYEEWMGLPLDESVAKFLHAELSNIRAEVTELEGKRKSIQNLQKNKLASVDVDIEDLTQIGLLDDGIGTFAKKYEKSLKKLESRLQKEKIQSTPITGFRNVGNTCYINSALQLLLAIPDFDRLVPAENGLLPYDNESDDLYRKRQAILTSFQDFLVAKSQGKSSAELGRLIGTLRKTIFMNGLLQGGFVDRSAEGLFQDAGSFFELMLYVIGQGFRVKTTKIYQLPDGNALPPKTSIDPHQILLLKSREGSVQQKIHKYGEEIQEELTPDNAYKYGQLKLTQFKEKNRIVGDPPVLLVLRVEHYSVNPDLDQQIDGSGLFDQIPESARYKLVGFAQNHSQVHWTSVAHDGNAWNYCNDSQVEKIETSNNRFKLPANYLVYRKI